MSWGGITYTNIQIFGEPWEGKETEKKKINNGWKLFIWNYVVIIEAQQTPGRFQESTTSYIKGMQKIMYKLSSVNLTADFLSEMIGDRI